MIAGVLWFLLALLLSASSAKASDAEIVARFFPQELKVRDGEAVDPSDLQQSFVTADLNHDGRPLIVALYSNDDLAALEILSPTADRSIVATTDEGIPGGKPKVSLLDIDGDGRQEILAETSAHRGGSAVWIYKWDGAALSRVHRAGDDGVMDDGIVDPTFLDIDGDGIVEAIEHTWSWSTDEAGDRHPEANYELLKWSDGKYVEENDVDEFALYLGGTGTDRRIAEDFTITDPEVPRRLLIVNGSFESAPRISNMIVKLNGRTVLSKKNFRPPATRIEVPLRVRRGENELVVKVYGAPGSEVALLVMPK